MHAIDSSSIELFKWLENKMLQVNDRKVIILNLKLIYALKIGLKGCKHFEYRST